MVLNRGILEDSRPPSSLQQSSGTATPPSCSQVVHEEIVLEAHRDEIARHNRRRQESGCKISSASQGPGSVLEDSMVLGCNERLLEEDAIRYAESGAEKCGQATT